MMQSKIDPRNIAPPPPLNKIAPPPPESDVRPKLKKWKGGIGREFHPPDWKLQYLDAHFVKENFLVENVVDEFSIKRNWPECLVRMTVVM